VKRLLSCTLFSLEPESRSNPQPTPTDLLARIAGRADPHPRHAPVYRLSPFLHYAALFRADLRTKLRARCPGGLRRRPFPMTFFQYGSFRVEFFPFSRLFFHESKSLSTARHPPYSRPPKDGPPRSDGPEGKLTVPARWPRKAQFFFLSIDPKSPSTKLGERSAPSEAAPSNVMDCLVTQSPPYCPRSASSPAASMVVEHETRYVSFRDERGPVHAEALPPLHTPAQRPASSCSAGPQANAFCAPSFCSPIRLSRESGASAFSPLIRQSGCCSTSPQRCVGLAGISTDPPRASSWRGHSFVEGTPCPKSAALLLE